jgi:ABC-type Mn2+/Zn2+ transport system permease subunit
MHRKAYFVLAGIFLVVALVVPPVVIALQADKDLDNYTVSQNPDTHSTSGNITVLTPEELQENHNTIFIVVLAVEVVFVALFAITMFYGINHPHPKH